MHAFISYAHADQKYLDRLLKHMAMLHRDNLIETWSDHKIIPGSKIGHEIDKSLTRSGIFLALVSSEYLASNYCYEKEFQQALALADAGHLRIIAVILEPCDWLSSPFSEYLCLPRDGKAIAEWTNENVAYLDVVKGLRRALGADGPIPGAGVSSPSSAGGQAEPARRLKVKQEFDAIQRRDFADQAFEVIRGYFRDSCAEINDVEDLKARFEEMGDAAFTCMVVNRSMMRERGEGHITVRNDKGRHHFGDISYVHESHAGPGTSNGGARVEADDYNLYLTLDEFMGRGEHKYDAKQVAERMWVDFVRQAGIEIDDD